jgi:hypothetical protein
MYVGKVGGESAVSIETRYSLNSPWIESLWDKIFCPVQTGPWAHPTFCTMGTVFLSLD